MNKNSTLSSIVVIPFTIAFVSVLSVVVLKNNASLRPVSITNAACDTSYISVSKPNYVKSCLATE